MTEPSEIVIRIGHGIELDAGAAALAHFALLRAEIGDGGDPLRSCAKTHSMGGRAG